MEYTWFTRAKSRTNTLTDLKKKTLLPGNKRRGFKQRLYYNCLELHLEVVLWEGPVEEDRVEQRQDCLLHLAGLHAELEHLRPGVHGGGGRARARAASRQESQDVGGKGMAGDG